MERNIKGQFVKGFIPWDKGKKRPEIKKWLTPFKKGNIPWNKGKKGVQKPSMLGKKLTLEARKKIKLSRLDKKFPKLSKARIKLFKEGKLVSWNKGKRYLSPKTKGKNHWNWKGGIMPEAQARLKTPEWDIIRKLVLKRDNYTCQKCGAKKKLDVHHKKPWRINKEDNPDNLISLCRKCHMREERLLSSS